MEDLIELLEKATEGSRELDALVGLACGAIPKKKNIYKARRHPPQLVRVDEVWPAFTTSVDAALTLVPDGMHKHMGDEYGDNRGGASWARIFPPHNQRNGTGNQWARTLPLALCIATLRARGK